jgi:hypothetical protein
MRVLGIQNHPNLLTVTFVDEEIGLSPNVTAFLGLVARPLGVCLRPPPITDRPLDAS